jgi:hypothetical protein
MSWRIWLEGSHHAFFWGTDPTEPLSSSVHPTNSHQMSTGARQWAGAGPVSYSVLEGKQGEARYPTKSWCCDQEVCVLPPLATSVLPHALSSASRGSSGICLLGWFSGWPRSSLSPFGFADWARSGFGRERQRPCARTLNSQWFQLPAKADFMPPLGSLWQILPALLTLM